MPRRRTPSERATRLARQIERIRDESPTAAALIEEWIERMLAGEPLEDLEPEMNLLRELFKRRGRR